MQFFRHFIVCIMQSSQWLRCYKNYIDLRYEFGFFVGIKEYFWKYKPPRPHSWQPGTIYWLTFLNSWLCTMNFKSRSAESLSFILKIFCLRNPQFDFLFNRFLPQIHFFLIKKRLKTKIKDESGKIFSDSREHNWKHNTVWLWCWSGIWNRQKERVRLYWEFPGR